VALAGGGLALALQRRRRGGRRHAVERHVDDGGDAAGGGRPGGGVEALPVRAAGLVDVDVRVHEPGQDDRVAGVDHTGAARRRVVEGGDALDHAVADVHRGGDHLAAGHHPLPADHQVGRVHDSRPPSATVARPEIVRRHRLGRGRQGSRRAEVVVSIPATSRPRPPANQPGTGPDSRCAPSKSKVH
jgi:hypothetical protein